MHKRWEWELHITYTRAGVRRLALKCALFVLGMAISLSVDFLVRGRVTIPEALLTCAVLLAGWNTFNLIRAARRTFSHQRQ